MRVFEECEDDEMTVEMPTGTGKSVLMSWMMSHTDGRVLVAFPRLALLSQFYSRYVRDHQDADDDRRVLIICTDQKDIRDTDVGDHDHLEGAVARQSLKETTTTGRIIILTTYHSLALVSKEGGAFDLTLFDEAHHRSEERVMGLVDENREKFGFLVNLSATPSEECGGEYFIYPFRTAVEDGAIRDYHVHYIYLDKKNLTRSMAESAVGIARLTGNRRCMAFTAFSSAEKENRSSVSMVVRQWKKVAGVEVSGITASTPASDRRKILESLSARQEEDTVRVVVSCRTLGEGSYIGV